VGSRPSRGLVVGIGAVLSVGILLPFTPVAPVLGFAPLPPSFFAFLGAVVLMYLVMVETLKSRAGRRTTIVISHHHSTISFCDDVVILSGGRVKKQAPFGALASLSMDELYQHEPLD